MDINAFTILPMSQRFSLAAGKTEKGSIKIVNPADATEDFSYKIGISPYGIVGEDYEADLVTDSNHTMIAKWIKISEPTGTVKPNETKEVEFTIEVPVDAPAGGQYAAITVSSNNEAKQSSGVAVQNVFEMASIVYGTVAGETRHEGEVLENNIPGFVVAPPVTLSALIKNEGNVHADATFVIAVSDFFSGRVILPTEEDDGEYSELIMPDTTRHIEREVSNLPSLGAIKISQTIYYNGNSNVQEKVVIICPIWFLALVIVTIAAIVTAIVRIIVKHRKHKRIEV